MKILKILVSLLTAVILSFGNIALAETNSQMDDASITKTVKEKFHNDQTLAREVIIIETKNGIVILSGDLKSQDNANKAVEQAQSVPGVSDVNTDRVTINGVRSTAASLRDAFITAKVMGAFLRDKLFGDEPISITTIRVNTKEGVVYLTGTAPSEAMVNTALRIAKTIRGVIDVKSDIKIEKKP